MFKKTVGVASLALLLAAGSVAPVQADEAQVDPTVEVVSAPSNAVVEFETTTVQTVPAPVAQEESTPEVVPEPILGGNLTEATPEPEPIVPEVPTTAPEPQPEPSAPEAPAPTPEPQPTTAPEPSAEPQPDPETNPVPTPEASDPTIDNPTMPYEEVEARTFMQSGESYVGSFAADSDTWTAQGYRVVVSPTIQRNVDGPLSGKYQSIFHVFSAK